MNEFKNVTMIRKANSYFDGKVTSSAWQQVGEGQSFDVPTNTEFDIKIHTVTDYRCCYLD